MNIRFLYLAGCPGMGPALDRLRKVMEAERVDGAIERVEIPGPEAASRERLLGSPSIQVNGLDIEEGRRADPPGFGCRIYPDGTPVPPEDMIRGALHRARGPRRKVLFLCTGNSCRSQIAEGWARALKGDVLEAYSAGIETHGLNPHAIAVMAEAGVDISGQRSERVDDLMDLGLDVVVTVCGHAHETCPRFPGRTRVVHVGFDDPPRLARELAARGADEAAQLDGYRRVRDEIRDFIVGLPDALDPAEEDHP